MSDTKLSVRPSDLEDMVDLLIKKNYVLLEKVEVLQRQVAFLICKRMSCTEQERYECMEQDRIDCIKRDLALRGFNWEKNGGY